MPYGQTKAVRVQQTVIAVRPGTWTRLEPTASNVGINQAGQTVTTPLANRFAVKIYCRGGAAVGSRAGISYTNAVGIKHAMHWIGSGQHVVEPADVGLTLWGRAKIVGSNNSMILVVTEYGA